MLEQAITAIERDRSAETTQHAEALARCRAGAAAEIAQGLVQVRALIAQGDKTQAGHALSRLDDRFGGLAAPDSVDLEHEITAK
jgi:hypothetical protein